MDKRFKKKIFFLIFLKIFFLNGCFSQEKFVYEKIPSHFECHRYKQYFEIENCDVKQNIILNEKISTVIERINYKQKKKYKKFK